MIAAQQIARLFGGFRSRVTLCAAALALLACAPATAPAQAPTFAELAQFKDPPEYSKKKSEVLSTGTADDATKKLFDEHYTFRIAEMTLRGSYDKLAAKRDDLKKKDLVPLGRAPSSELHDRLTEFLATRLPRLCADSQYHPAVRQNWTLILGDLNSKEPAFNGQGEVPLTAVLPELQKLYVDENQHVAVRLAALVGIKRHVKANATADVRKQLAKAMTAIVANKQPPKGTDQKTYDFFRLRTIDALRTILDSAPDAGDETAAAALAELTADAKVKLYYRCEAAAAIGQLESRSIKKEDVPQLARLFGELAVEVTKREAPPAAAPPPPGPGQPMQPRDAAEPMPKDPADAKQPADAAKTPPPAGAPPAVPMPDPAPKAAPDAHGGADGARPGPRPVAPAPAPAKSGLSRGVQAYYLACVRQGFKGSKPNRGLAGVPVEADTKKLVDDLLAKVEELLRLVNDRTVNDTDLPSKLDLVNAGLREMIRAPQADKASAGVGSVPMQVRAEKP